MSCFTTDGVPAAAAYDLGGFESDGACFFDCGGLVSCLASFGVEVGCLFGAAGGLSDGVVCLADLVAGLGAAWGCAGATGLGAAWVCGGTTGLGAAWACGGATGLEAAWAFGGATGLEAAWDCGGPTGLGAAWASVGVIG